jgi:putative MATE family efflux protein
MRTEPDLSVAGQKSVRGKSRELDRRILILAVPALAALAADPLLSLVDTAFVVGLGAPALAALAINGAVFGFAFVVFNFLAYATTPLVAQALGRDEPDQVRTVVARALWLAIGLGVLSSGLLVGLANPLVRLLQAGPEVIEPAVAYLQVRALAAPAVLVVTVGHGAFRGFQDTRTPLLVALGANVIHVVLDALLIYGAGWGVRGAATASLIAQVAAAMWFWRLLHRRLGPIRLHQIRWRDIRPFLRTGGLLTLRTMLLVLTASVGTATAARIGTNHVAAHQVVRESWFLSAMLVDGLAIAAQAMVAEQVGRGDETAATRVGGRLIFWGVVVGLVMGGLWLVGGPWLGSALGPNDTVTELIGAATRIAAVIALPAALLWVLDGIFLARLRLSAMAVSTGAGLVAAVVIFWLTIKYGWGLDGVWWGMGAMVAARLIVLAWAYGPMGVGRRKTEDGSQSMGLPLA